jgi:hypothetical protein
LNFFSEVDGDAEYELFSVIEYQPTAGLVLGHFISFGLVNGDWLKFNDNRISQEADITSGAKSPFMLFYRRLKGKRGVVPRPDSVASIVIDQGMRRDSDTPSLTSSASGILSEQRVEYIPDLPIAKAVRYEHPDERFVPPIVERLAPQFVQAPYIPSAEFISARPIVDYNFDDESSVEETVLIIGRKRNDREEGEWRESDEKRLCSDACEPTPHATERDDCELPAVERCELPGIADWHGVEEKRTSGDFEPETVAPVAPRARGSQEWRDIIGIM